MKVKSESAVAQSCPTLSDPMDCSLRGSSVHGIFQARVLEWGAIALSVTYKGTPIRLSAEISAETSQTRMEWHDIFKALKEKKKKIQPRILYMQSFHPKLKER